jgi:hypothetical protein
MRFARPLVLLAIIGALTQPRSPAAEPVRVVQPVHEYFTPFAACPDGDGHDFNSRYTHIGTDFGRMGPAQDHLVWQPGAAKVDLSAGGWAGMWHSLAGLARERAAALDFLRCYPPFIRDAFQPRCVGVTLRAAGVGRLKLEVKSPDERPLWTRTVDLHGEPLHQVVLACDPAQLRHAKLLNWVAEPGARLCVDAIGLLIEFPPMPFPDRVFLTAYAKLARCYAPQTSLVRDQQQRPAGEFDAVPASGMFALCTAVAAKLGVVDGPFAEQTLHAVHHAAQKMPRAEGLLPHFVRQRVDGTFAIHPGTEFSTVDTSLFFHGMMLAAQLLGDRPEQDALLAEVRAIRFDRLRTPDGALSHGLREDGRTPLACSWADWGGETALAVLLERMADRQPDPPRVSHAGKVPNGIGFIGEVQSLFYPQFDEPEPDRLTGACWPKARRELLEEQRSYFAKRCPDCPAAKLGLYGLSAGEAYRSRGYVANGAEGPPTDLIHPHYLLMSARLRPPAEAYRQIEILESHGLMPPWGLVENVTADLREYLPLQSSLNAAFECLGAYHLAARALNRPDAIYEAARDCPPAARAVATFYPRK